MYANSMLNKYYGKKIVVLAVYVNIVKKYGDEYAYLAVLRNIGGDLLRDHMWCREIEPFLNFGNIETGSIIQFDGRVSTYYKGKDKSIVDYTLCDIENLMVIGNAHSQIQCYSCNYRMKSAALQEIADKYIYLLQDKEKRELALSQKYSNERIENSITTDENRKLIDKTTTLNRKLRSLRKENIIMIEILEDIYELSQRKSIKNVDRLKQRLMLMVGTYLKCDDCKRILNNCKC